MNISSQAEAIRRALDELGALAAYNDVLNRVKEMGVENVSPQQVSNEKRRRRERPNIEDLPVSVLKKVKALVDDVGSVAVVRQALDELEKVQYESRG